MTQAEPRFQPRGYGWSLPLKVASAVEGRSKRRRRQDSVWWAKDWLAHVRPRLTGERVQTEKSVKAHANGVP
jgi:hypothetical protein